MDRTLVKDALADVAVGSEVTVAGWVRTLRASKGGFSFITLNDGSCMACLQVVADKDLPNYESEITQLAAGCSIIATGKLVDSPAQGQRARVRGDQAADLRVAGSGACREHATTGRVRELGRLWR